VTPDRAEHAELDRVAALLLDHDRRIERIEVGRANDAKWARSITTVILTIVVAFIGSLPFWLAR
jgi:hypothetical protein